MIIKRKLYSVVNAAFAVMDAGSIIGSRKEQKQSAQEHEAAMISQKKEGKQLVDQLNNIVKS